MKKQLTMLMVGLNLLCFNQIALANDTGKRTYELYPGVSLSIFGSFFRSQTKDCVVRAEGAVSTLNFTSLHHDTIINGVLLKENMTVNFTAPINSHFYLEMDRNAELEVTNLSNWVVNLSCD